MLTTTTKIEVTCDRCGAVLGELTDSSSREPGPVLLSLSGSLVGEAVEWRDLCDRCLGAVANILPRLLLEPRTGATPSPGNGDAQA